METIEKIQTRHKETLKTFDSILSVLAPVSFDNKTFFVDDKNIDRLAKSSDFLSNEFCGVCVISERIGTPGTGTDKTTHKIKLTGENFGYEIEPGALPYIRKNIEKSFKAVETFTKQASKKQVPIAGEMLRKTAAMLINDSNKVTNNSNIVYICKESESKRHTEGNEEINPKIDELKTVNFQIEGKYIDQIKAGTKTQDYRAINPVNARKLCYKVLPGDKGKPDFYVTHFKEIWRVNREITHVRFTNGYKTDRKEILCELKDLQVNTYRENLPEGLKPGTSCFTLFLGQIVVSKNFES